MDVDATADAPANKVTGEVQANDASTTANGAASADVVSTTTTTNSSAQPQQGNRNSADARQAPQPQDSNTTAEEDDAVRYLEKIRNTFCPATQPGAGNDEKKKENKSRYNEFLLVMRSFQKKLIDTPEVIRNVSELFKGYPDLILGFKTFLPPGYKFEIDAAGNLISTGVPSSSTTASASSSQQPQQQQQQHRPSQQQQQQQQQPGMAGGMMQPNAAPPHMMMQHPQHLHGGMNPMMMQQQRGNMQQQQQQQQGQHMGHPGMNPMMMMMPQSSASARPMIGGVPPQHMQQQQQGGQQQQAIGQSRGSGGGLVPIPPRPAPFAPGGNALPPGMVGSAAGGPPPVRGAPAQQRTGPGAGPLEYDHAINYVTRIKKRFVKDADTYKEFLEILHTYQKRQKGIREVLERVSLLFADHPDLLRDFTYFLPDSVQEQARERIQRTLNENKARRDAEMAAATGRRMGPGGDDIMSDAGGPNGGLAGGGYGRGGLESGSGKPYAPPMAKDRDHAREVDRADAREYVERGLEDRELSMRERERDRERERMIDRARDRGQVGMGPGKSPRMQVVVKKRRDRESETHLTDLTPTERSFFNRVKAAVGGRDGWIEFLKVLELYSAEVLTRAELLQLIQDILPTSGAVKKGLMDEIKAMVTNKGFAEPTQADVWYSMPIGEVDFSQCTRCTMSYRHLPVGYPKLNCSERSRLEMEVLNDAWVSVPTGSEDFSFKITRKNQFEEALFRCEDERHEVDQCLENNASAIRVLEPLNDEITALKEHSKSTEWLFRLDRRSLGVLHLKAIARVYGDHGHEILELLRKNPAGAIPIILARLKAKDEEWKRARAELNKGWKAMAEENYVKSLDHRSFYFKGADKKAIQSKNLLAEIKGKVEAAESDLRGWREAQIEAAKTAASAAAASKAVAAAGAVSDAAEAKLIAFEDAAAAAAAAAAATATTTTTSGMEVEAEGGAKPATTPTAAAEAGTTAAITDAAAKAEPTPSAVPSSTAVVPSVVAPTPAAVVPETEPVGPPTSTAAIALAADNTPLPRSLRAKLRSNEPVLHFMYRDISVHKDAYSLLAYAIEHTVPAADKVACMDLWRTFISHFFQLPRAWMFSAPLAAYPHGYGSADGDRPDAVGPAGLFQMGEIVQTPYGMGVIADVRVGASMRTDIAVPATLSSSSLSASSDSMNVDGVGIATTSTGRGRRGTNAAAAAVAASSSATNPDGSPILFYEILLDYGRASILAQYVKAAPGSDGGNRSGSSSTITATGKSGDATMSSSSSSSSSTSSSTSDAAVIGGKVKPTTSISSSSGVPSTAGSAPVVSTAGTVDASASPHGVTIGGITYKVAAPPSPSAVTYVNAIGYVFFRLHQMIVDRLIAAKLFCAGGRAKDARNALHPADRAAAEVKKAAAAASKGAASNSTIPAAAAATAAAATGAKVPKIGQGVGETGAAVAAAAGNLSAAAVASVNEGMEVEDSNSGTSSSSSSSSSSSATAAGTHSEAYAHFLTALYNVLDNSLESSKFEDECRELMGSAAYATFTLDKVVTAAAKQFVAMVHDSTSQKLRSLWEHAQSRIARATRTKTGAEAERDVAHALSNYRTAVAVALLPRAEYDRYGASTVRSAVEEAFAVQYVVNTPDVVGDAHGDDILFGVDGENNTTTTTTSSSSSSNAASISSGPATPRHHQTASLTIRYCGKALLSGPVLPRVPPTVKGFQYARALPSYLSRMVTPTTYILGDESTELEEEDAAAAKRRSNGEEDEDLVLGPFGLPMPPPRQTPVDV